MFQKKNKLILLGAGAVIDIGGPLTICNNSKISKKCCLTHSILNCGINIQPNIKLIYVIYAELTKTITTPNFEDLINFIENTIVSTKYPNHLSYSNYYKFLRNNLILEIKQEKIILNSFYEIDTKEKDTLSIYFIVMKDLLVEIINLIRERVRQYECTNNIEFNNKFSSWFNELILNRYKKVNIYSINYDQYLFDLISKTNKKIKLAKPDNIDKNNTLNYYNLHGSINWKISDTNNKRSYKIEYCDKNEKTDIQVTEIADKFTLLSPIITGRDKVNKIFSKPFQDFINCFNDDALTADDIYIIGYSFLDNHINSILRKALEKNPNAKITVINPGLYVQEFVSYIYDDLKINTDTNKKRNIINPSNNSFEIEGSNMRLFREKFLDYLTNPHNKIKLINTDLPVFEQLKQRFE